MPIIKCKMLLMKYIGACLLIVSLSACARSGGEPSTALRPLGDIESQLATLQSKVVGDKGGETTFKQTYEKCSPNLQGSTFAAMSTKIRSDLEKGVFGSWGQNPLVRRAIAIHLATRALGETISPSSDFTEIRKALNVQKIDSSEVKAFLDDLKGVVEEANSGFSDMSQKEPLWLSIDDALNGPNSSEIKFSTVLIAYLREYFDGKFVTHFGGTIAQGQVNEKGIPDAAIAGVTTVFFEALFDYLDSTPIAADKDWNTIPGGSSNGSVKLDDEPDNFWGSAAKNQARPTALAVLKSFTLNGNEESLFGNVGTKKNVTDANKDSGCGVTDEEARAISSVSTWFGNRVVIWNGAILEELASVNVGFVVGGNFAVGDNKTLVTVAKAAFEVIGRRAAEHVLYHVFYSAPRQPFEGLTEFFPVQTVKSGVASPPVAENGKQKPKVAAAAAAPPQ
jgi:hypothetical protein